MGVIRRHVPSWLGSLSVMVLRREATWWHVVLHGLWIQQEQALYLPPNRRLVSTCSAQRACEYQGRFRYTYSHALRMSRRSSVRDMCQQAADSAGRYNACSCCPQHPPHDSHDVSWTLTDAILEVTHTHCAPNACDCLMWAREAGRFTFSTQQPQL